MSAKVAAVKAVAAVASDKRGRTAMFNNNAVLFAFNCVYGCHEQCR